MLEIVMVMLREDYSPLLNTLNSVESASGDRPSIGFCIELLLGSKYEGFVLLCSEKTIPPYIKKL